MNHDTRIAFRPVLVSSIDPRPRATVFDPTPPHIDSIPLEVVRRSITQRSTRTGWDKLWVEIFALIALLLSVGFASVHAATPMDNWHPAPVGATSLKFLNDLIFVDGKFWAVGLDGQVQHSTDGRGWTTVQTPTARTLTSIAHGNSVFVAVGYGMTLLSSPNGTDWTIREQDASSAGYSFSQVIFANGKFLAFSGVTGDVRLSTNGINWTPAQVAGIKFYPDAVAWGNERYAMVGSLDGNYPVQTSPDGITWTRRYTSFTKDLGAIAFFNGLFIAGGTDLAPMLATSPDGITWTKLSQLTFPAADMEFWGIKVLNGRVFAFGDYGLLMSSDNGTDWIAHTTGTTDTIRAIEYDGHALLIARSNENATTASGSDPWAPVSGDPDDPVDPVDPNATAQIANISTRAWIGSGESKLITGFVVSGTTPKKVLIRGVGPTLAGFGVPGTIVDPMITLYNGASQEIASNNDWSTFADQAALAAETTKVFAFALNAASKDAAMLVTLPPGSYTLHLAGFGGGTGVGLAEVYDCATVAACRLVNVSSRGFIGLGDNVAIPGFVVSGNKPKKLLVRGVGPTLGTFGVGGTIADPKITLYNSSQAVVATNDNWTTAANQVELAAATAQVFAFALNGGSLDAAMLVTVNPGSYTAVVSGNNNGTGVALVEVYEVE